MAEIMPLTTHCHTHSNKIDGKADKRQQQALYISLSSSILWQSTCIDGNDQAKRKNYIESWGKMLHGILLLDNLK